ncbi:hypothetical protein D3C84_982680 [compost metagenome]
MRYQVQARCAGGAIDQAKQPARQVHAVKYALSHLMYCARQPWVPGMSLDYHRATGRQCRSGVAAQDRKSEREVAG